MRILRLMFVCAAMLGAGAIGSGAHAQSVSLSAPEVLVDTGLFRHILPRFSLKNQIPVELVTGPEAQVTLSSDAGRALFQQGEITWHMVLAEGAGPRAQRLADWLSGEVGQRTILGFAPDGTALFTAPAPHETVTVETSLEGNARAGLTVARAQCARCHAVEESGRKNDIGSTPSFFVLRSFDNWLDRFSAFFALRPHPAFTQVEAITPPFPENLPPAIVPITLSLDDLDNLLAYVEGVKPADLGAPLVHQ